VVAGSGLVSGFREDEDSGEDTDDLIEDARNFVTIGRRSANIKRKKGRISCTDDLSTECINTEVLFIVK
jgi:hypothetical protein